MIFLIHSGRTVVHYARALKQTTMEIIKYEIFVLSPNFNLSKYFVWFKQIYEGFG